MLNMKNTLHDIKNISKISLKVNCDALFQWINWVWQSLTYHTSDGHAVTTAKSIPKTMILRDKMGWCSKDNQCRHWKEVL